MHVRFIPGLKWTFYVQWEIITQSCTPLCPALVPKIECLCTMWRLLNTLVNNDMGYQKRFKNHWHWTLEPKIQDKLPAFPQPSTNTSPKRKIPVVHTLRRCSGFEHLWKTCYASWYIKTWAPYPTGFKIFNIWGSHLYYKLDIIRKKKKKSEICLRGYCTPDHFCDYLCIFLKNYNTLVTSKICFL